MIQPPPPYNFHQVQPPLMPPYPVPQKHFNSLVIHRIPADVTRDNIFSIFSKYGKVGHIFHQIKEKGVAYITFYDTRWAEAALADCMDLEINGRKVDVEPYTRPTPNLLHNKSEYSPYIHVTSKNQAMISRITYDEIGRTFANFGDIRSITFPYPGVIEVEYFDFRNAQKAQDESHRIKLAGTVLIIKQVAISDLEQSAMFGYQQAMTQMYSHPYGYQGMSPAFALPPETLHNIRIPSSNTPPSTSSDSSHSNRPSPDYSAPKGVTDIIKGLQS